MKHAGVGKRLVGSVVFDYPENGINIRIVVTTSCNKAVLEYVLHRYGFHQIRIYPWYMHHEVTPRRGGAPSHTS